MANDSHAAEGRYAIADEDRLAAGLGPRKSEHYGPTWEIRMTGAPCNVDPLVIIPDPGDGSAGQLAKRILKLLNAE